MLRLLVNSPVERVGSLKTVPKSCVDVDRIKADLTVRNGAYWFAVNSGNRSDKQPFLELYKEEGNSILVPRHYKVPYVGKPPMVIDNRNLDHGRTLRHLIGLRNEVQKEASEALRRNCDDKILVLACGQGKSPVALHAAAEGSRLPVLVIVHTRALLEQWRNKLSEFYNIHIYRVGSIWQKKIFWRETDCAVAMLQSLLVKRPQLSPEFFSYWRLVIFDECHRTGAEHFSQVCSMFPSERWGLTATHTRADEMDFVFKLHIGKVIYQNLEQDLKPEVYFVNTGFDIPTARFIHRGGKLSMPRLTNWLSDHTKRNELIVKFLDRAANSKRTVLVLGERLRQLYDLAMTCKATSKALHVGSMNAESRAEALKQQFVFATQHIAREGLDRPAFDTLFILQPFSGEGRLQQSIGRILRTHYLKKAPKCVVFVDNAGISIAMARRMRKWFVAQGIIVHDVQEGEQI